MERMTFEDLPPDVSSIPLTDRRIAADVIDLIIGDADRAGGCIGVMLCDAEDRGLTPVVVSEVPADADVGGLCTLLEVVLPLLSEQGGSVLLGRGRPRGTRPCDADRAWHQLSIDRCAAHGVRLLGFYLATRDGIVRLPEPLTAAS
jgi:hypothetical protein